MPVSESLDELLWIAVVSRPMPGETTNVDALGLEEGRPLYILSFPDVATDVGAGGGRLPEASNEVRLIVYEISENQCPHGTPITTTAATATHYVYPD